MTDGPSLPPPRYAHTLHVEAPQPKPFVFLLGVALLAFAVPAGLVFAFLRFVADAPPAAPAAVELAGVEPARPAEAPAPTSVVFEIADASADAAFLTDAAPLADAAMLLDAAVAPDAADAAPPPAVVAPPSPAGPITWEMGMGILHSCRNTTGKYLDGYQECGSAGELDHYLAKVVAQELVACEKGAPTGAVIVRTNVDFGTNGGTVDVLDGKMNPITSAWTACLAEHFVLENLGKIRHNHPKYTLTYRVVPHLPGDSGR